MSTRALPYTIVDAFTDTPFKGNPASVILFPPDTEIPASETLQLISREFNLAETAFLTPRPEANSSTTTATYGLRWFTPAVEVPLCGHATLASAKFLFASGILADEVTQLHFLTLSGTLMATKLSDGKIELEFPGSDSVPLHLKGGKPEALVAIRKAIKGCLGDEVEVLHIHVGTREKFEKFVLVEIDGSVDLQLIKAKPQNLASLTDYFLFAVTQKSSKPGLDFESRVFAPNAGIDEDPVTGAAHCLLTPYWATKWN
ncbi:Diaminopimelate epimerase-like protein, partial [Sistotremastrum niveocremeum HHB9708]